MAKYTGMSVYLIRCSNCPSARACHLDCDQYCVDDEDSISQLISLVCEQTLTLEEYNEWAQSHNEPLLKWVGDGYDEL